MSLSCVPVNRALVFLGLIFALETVGAERIPADTRRRLDILQDVWRVIDRNFYDTNFNGVNWTSVRERYVARLPQVASEKDFYVLIDEMLAELKSSHVSFQRPASLQQNKRATVAGLRVERCETNFVVAEVAKTFPSAEGQITRGDRILSVDGIPTDEHARRLSELLGRYASAPTPQALEGLLKKLFFIGDAGTSVEIKLAQSAGGERVVQLKRDLTSEARFVEAKVVSKDVGYLRFSAWIAPNDEEIEAKVAEMKSLPAIIIDLRRNPGGHDQPTSRITSLFFPENTPWGTWRERSGREERFTTGKAKLHYSGRLIVLIDEGSASASENFAALVQETGRGKVIGSRTCGCLTATRWDKVKGGGKVGYPHRVVFTTRGQKIEGRGVVPDVTITPTLEQLVAGEDVPLNTAIAMAGP